MPGSTPSSAICRHASSFGLIRVDYDTQERFWKDSGLSTTAYKRVREAVGHRCPTASPLS